LDSGGGWIGGVEVGEGGATSAGTTEGVKHLKFFVDGWLVVVGGQHPTCSVEPIGDFEVGNLA